MAVLILTLDQAKKVTKIAAKYNEYFEYVTGKAKQDYVCDHTGENIAKGADCAVGILLSNNNHENLEFQQLSLNKYVEIKNENAD